MHMIKPVSTELDPHFKLLKLQMSQSKNEMEHMSKFSYARTIGRIMYAMVCICLDISQTLSMVSRYMDNPGKRYWKTVNWILRYLKGGSDIGLTF